MWFRIPHIVSRLLLGVDHMIRHINNLVRLTTLIREVIPSTTITTIYNSDHPTNIDA